MGNQFLANIREANAIAHVVRCFEDSDVTHVDGRIDPVADVETIDTELCLKDLESVDKRIERAQRAIKGPGSKEEKAALEVALRLKEALESGKPVRAVEISDEERPIVKELQLLTDKRVFYVANVSEAEMGDNPAPLVDKLKAHAAKEGAPVVKICAATESEIASLDKEDQPEFLESVGLQEPGLNRVVRTAYVNYWSSSHSSRQAPTNAGRGPFVEDLRPPRPRAPFTLTFKRGFIKADVIWWEDLIELKSEAACRQAAKLSMEGKEYVVRDGDVIHFKFNV